MSRSFLDFFRSLGPGLVTGASDDDPAGIAVYTQAGAGFGYATLWLALFTTPLMIAVQEMCARIALVTNEGLTMAFLRKFPRWLVVGWIVLLGCANIFNIGADLSMMAASVRLILPGSFVLWLIALTIFILACQIFISYKTYERGLKWLTASLFAYILVALIVHIPWTQALHATFIPQMVFGKEFALIVIAILGTTLSPYLYFWQANQEVEDNKHRTRTPEALTERFHVMREDVGSGMAFSNVAFWFIVATAAAVLRPAGIFSIQTADQAARVLEPLVGRGAFWLFTLGILGTGLLTVPVLSGSLAYAVNELYGWRGSLAKKWFEAKRFYATIIVSALLGLGIALIHIPPVRMLIYSGIANAVVAPPLLGALLLVSNDRKVLKQWTNGRWANAGGFIAFFTMLAAAFLWIWYAFF